jgi:hypothetical protein
VVPRSGIFLGMWRSTLTGSSDGKMNVQSACALNTLILIRAQMVIFKKIEGHEGLVKT